MAEPVFESLPPSARSLRHWVAELLREAITTGRLGPGDRLLEEELSKQMNVSRGPIREALRLLEQEGLVVSFPNRGTEVATVSIEEVREILIPIRLILERFACRHALAELTEVDFSELERLVDEMRAAGQSNNLPRVVETDVQFHERILERAEQPHCTQIWRTIAPRVRAYFFRCGPEHESLDAIAQEHQELIDAMRDRDLDQVFRVLEQHIRGTVLELIDATPSQ